ncbi:MAG: tRNA 2-selenouridine(34) synthase MnmH [Granulosicoccus sp.]
MAEDTVSIDHPVDSIPSEDPVLAVDDYRALLLSGRPMIDVRAPVEYAKGAIPGSSNLPLMNDEERHLVGIRYKKAGQQSAIELGAQLVGEQKRYQRTQCWLDFVKSNPDSVLCCFRGGLRSRIAQQWLLDAGAYTPLVKGGYKALRSFLIENLNHQCATLSMIIIGGRTGNGKTILLKRLKTAIDLEALAKHRGSSFGGVGCPQPSNVEFENAVSTALLRYSATGANTVFLEDEARLIGRVCLPDTLRAAMQKAPIYIVESEMEQRIDNCFDDYVTDLLHRYVSWLGPSEGFQAYAEHHRSSLARIRKRLGGQNYAMTQTRLDKALHHHLTHDDTTCYREFIGLLLTQYYDPMYDYQLSHKADRVVYSGTAEEIYARVNDR